jgi:uncharacterized protein YqhQ
VSELNIGGQAVIEGVMMRDKESYAVAVRLPEGNIETEITAIKPWHKIFQKPFLRGIKALVENLQIGYRTLEWSAKKQDNTLQEKNSIWESLTIFITIIFALGFFIVLPNIIIHWFGMIEEQSPLLYNLASGGIRLSLFTIYILGISLVKDVRRVFQYHGAEHKVIHTFEKGLELTLDNIKKFSTVHKRCGTSFLFLLIFMSILIFSLVAPLLLQVFSDFTTWHIVARKSSILAFHILLLPFIASLSYELLKLTAKDNIVSRTLFLLAYPGLFFQRITTQEPDEKQIEVAVASLKTLLDKPKA